VRASHLDMLMRTHAPAIFERNFISFSFDFGQRVDQKIYLPTKSIEKVTRLERVERDLPSNRK